MEKLIFKKNGSIEKFIEWIERFKGDISKDSLIVEVDHVSQLFISKTYSTDKSLVRYSQISFADANLDVEMISDALKQSGRRVFIGIFVILPKFIEVLKTFATSDTFTMEIDCMEQIVAEKEEICTVSVKFKSKTLTMQIPGSSLNATEMVPMTDEVFRERVWVASDPVSVNLSGDLLKNLVSISDIFTSNEKLKNYMEFYTSENEEGKKILKVREPQNLSYDYELGELTEGSVMKEDFSISIYRDRFLLAVKNAFSDTELTISSSNPNRVLIKLGNGDTKTIIARVKKDF